MRSFEFALAFWFFFFFSSRRRHTRLQGDWSSDVCSSDLLPFSLLLDVDDAQQFVDGRDAFQHLEDTIIGQSLHPIRDRLITDLGRRTTLQEIGRASCRERCRSRWSPYH